MSVDSWLVNEQDIKLTLCELVPVQGWFRQMFLFTFRCSCECCQTDTLVGSLEFRCCREVTSTSAKLVFDGSIEHIKCVTQHENYGAIANQGVLLQLAPLSRNKDGGTYRRRGGVSQNEFIRSVACRWTTRWLCGYMGWDNTRPLPACVYLDIRTKYQSRQLTGYCTSQDRD